MGFLGAGMATAAATEEDTTRLCDLPEACVAYVLALTSPWDACRCAAVSPCFRDAAESDVVWARFLPPDYRAILQLHQAPARRLPLSRSGSTAGAASPSGSSKKEAFLGLTDAAVLVDGGGMAVWLARGSGAKCVALSARRLSLPWEDGEFSWRWTPHPLSRFADVAQLEDCTCLDIYGRLPTAALTPATAYAAYLVFVTTDAHRGLSFPDQETTISVGGSAPSRHTVCLRPDAAEARRFRGGKGTDGVDVRGPALRGDGWWEIEMGRLRTGNEAVAGEEVAVSFEMLGWYHKRGLVVEGVEFRPL
ncbi:F-box protein PP2-B10-like [Triticum urartu]|uniref:F-box domain-containing protein n=1 Tax=Triticum urartu TaxID=4572 RepID=A0A8R7PN63_TRIUA|nr:F-box protein PP2-B10-like [Triticum urartu]XP_048567583.1 F-box protein PP2-B10-like [Triticum urartu]